MNPIARPTAETARGKTRGEVAGEAGAVKFERALAEAVERKAEAAEAVAGRQLQEGMRTG